MVRRKLLGVGAAVVGMAATNRFLRRAPDELPELDEGNERTFRWRGMDIAYAEAGDPADPDVLLVHAPGLAASGHEFDATFDALAEEYHVIAPDLPGYGRSDRPAIRYTSSLYESFLADFARAMTEDAAVIAAGHSGAYTARIATEVGFDRLVLVAPTTGRDRERPWMRALLRTPLVGTSLYNVAVSAPALRRQSAGSDGVEYRWLSAHLPGARYAPSALIAGDLDPDASLGSILAGVDVPVTLVWGRGATDPPLTAGHRLAEEADATLLVVEGAGDRPQVEDPDAFVEALERALPRIEEE